MGNIKRYSNFIRSTAWTLRKSFRLPTWVLPANWTLAGWALAGISASTAAGAGFFFLFVAWIGPLEDGRRGSQLFDAARTTVTLVGIVGLGGAAFLAYRKQKSNEDGHSLESQREERQRVVDLRTRYTSCAEQLGHSALPIRRAGVYGLASLADDWMEYGREGEAQVCIDLLCACLKAASPSDSLGHIAEEHREDSEVSKAITGAVAKRTDSRNYTIGKWSGLRFDFSFADLSNVEWSGARMDYVSFSHANLTCARLNESKLIGASFRNATLSSTLLFRVDLSRSDFSHARLESVILLGANLSGADLSGATISDCLMEFASIADVLKVDYDTFPGMDVRYDSEAKWPVGLTPSSPEFRARLD